MQDKTTTLKNLADDALNHWRAKEKLALELLKIAGDLRFDKSIELVLFRTPIYDVQPSKILSLHQFSQNYDSRNLAIEITLAIAKSIQSIEKLSPAKIDLGALGLDWLKEEEDFSNADEFVNFKLRSFIGTENRVKENKDIVLYGFGRIGRLAARIIINQTGRGDQLRLRAIVIRPKLKDRYEEAVKRAALLKSDTVHGEFVVLTAPGKGIPNIVIGANQESYDLANFPIISAASCTTNAIVPVLKVVQENYGIENGHIETIHAYTNDQNLIDNFHKKPRRGRGAPTNEYPLLMYPWRFSILE